jgi:hypothetical protein
MTTLLDLRTEARALINEPVARVITDTDLTRWANYGIKDFSANCRQYQRIVAVAAVASKGDYTLPTDILALLMCRFQDKYRVEVVDLSKFAASTFYNANPVGIPSIVTLSPFDKRMRLYAPPSVSSPATTLSGAHNSSVTTLTVASTTGFPKSGHLLLAGGEQVRYENTDATHFLLCQRGDGDTTAGTYVGGEAVTEGRIILTTAAIPPELSANGDVPKFPDQYINCIPAYMAWRAELKRQNAEKATFYQQEYMRVREEAEHDTFWSQQGENSAVHDEEYGMGWYGQV